MKQRKQFRIRLHEAFEKDGRSVYAIHKQIEDKVSYNTVNKYLLENLMIDRLPPEIEIIASALDLDWRSVVDIVEAEDESPGQIKTLLAPA